MSGSEGGPEKPTDRKVGRALRLDPYHTNVGWEIITRPYGSGPKGEQADMNAARVPAEGERGDEEDD